MNWNITSLNGLLDCINKRCFVSRNGVVVMRLPTAADACTVERPWNAMDATFEHEFVLIFRKTSLAEVAERVVGDSLWNLGWFGSFVGLGLSGGRLLGLLV